MLTQEYSYAEELALFNAHVREGRTAEAREVLEGLIDREIPEGFLYLSFVDLCKMDNIQTEPDKMREYLRKAIALATGNDPQVVVASKVELARVEAYLGDRSLAIAYLQEARDGFLALDTDARWPEFRQKILIDIADIANHFVKNGYYDLAKLILTAAIDLGAAEPFLYLALGNVCRSLQDSSLYPIARDYLLSAIALAIAKADAQVVVAALAGLADTETLLGDREKAELYRKGARARFKELPAIEQWEELRERIENNGLAPRPIEYLLFTSPCGSCTTAGISRGRFAGKDATCKGC